MSRVGERRKKSGERAAHGVSKGRAKLKKRTLTNLYNAIPTWLKNVHATLDAAVFAAYGWPAGLTEEEILGRSLELNLARAGKK